MKLKNSSNVSIYSKGKESYAIFKSVHKKIINIIPSMMVSFPDANGLFFVRVTNLSKSLS